MRVDSDNRTMTWTLDRPAQGNGLDEPTMAQMETALDTVEPPDSGFSRLCVAGNATVLSIAAIAKREPALILDIGASLRAANPVSDDRSYRDAFHAR